MEVDVKTFNPIPAALVAMLASAHVSAGETYLDQLARLQAQTSLLQQEMQLLQIQQQMAAASSIDTSLPKVVAVYGEEGNWQARLLMPDGSTRTVRENQYIGDTLKVAAISGGGVEAAVKNGKKWRRVSLSFASAASPSGQTVLLPAMLLPPPPAIELPKLEALPAQPTAQASTPSATPPDPATATQGAK